MKIKVRDVDMFYMVQGQGEPALVMHGGLGADHTCFLNTPFNKLSSRLKLYYYDHRCNGRSSCPSIETMTHENLAKDAEALRRALGLDNFTLIGHSYGGIAALEYASRYQSNLRRLLLITTAPSGELLIEARKMALKRAPELISTVDKILNAEIHSDEEFEDALGALAPLYFNDYDSFKDAATRATKDVKFRGEAYNYSFSKLLPEYDVRDKLREIKVPTLILCGRHDWITPVNQSEAIHDGLPNSELVIFENSAHWVYIEEEELFMMTVNDWLDRT
jgi:proline iminopeptidase